MAVSPFLMVISVVSGGFLCHCLIYSSMLTGSEASGLVLAGLEPVSWSGSTGNEEARRPFVGDTCNRSGMRDDATAFAVWDGSVGVSLVEPIECRFAE